MHLATRSRVRLVVSIRNLGSASHPTQPTSGNSNLGTPNAEPKKGKVAIKIPFRIERNSTDILRSLASTIGRDVTAPHYKYHDDPYLIPNSNFSKRNYALAKESGRKAARWIRQQHSDLFQHRVAQPPVEAFLPPVSFKENESLVCEKTLLDLIDLRQLSEAMELYKLLESKNAEISLETKQALLELACYYNDNAALDEEFLEQQWFSKGFVGREQMKNTWTAAGFAETLFSSMNPPTADAIQAMIRGRAKFYHAEKAWQLYQEALSLGVSLDVETYNSLLKVVNFLRESAEARWQLLNDLLKDMSDAKVTPNTGTLNACIESVCFSGNPKASKKHVLRLLAEFKAVQVEPSLGTYYFILNLFCRDRGPTSTILADILKHIEGKEFAVQDTRDFNFFVTALEVCRNHLNDLQLAEKVDKLLHVGNNYSFIGDALKESVYYRHLMTLKCEGLPFEEFMEYYNAVVPNIYIPEPSVTEVILRHLELSGAASYLPQLWSDIVTFDQSHREELLSLSLNIMRQMFPSDEQSELAQEFQKISLEIWKVVEADNNSMGRIKSVQWTGKMLGDLLAVQIKVENVDFASDVMLKLVNSSGGDILGVPDIQVLWDFLHLAIKNDKGSMALACIQYTSEAGFPDAGKMAEEACKKINFDSIQMARLTNILGYEVKKSNTSSV